jgi:hypothetical protein
MKKVFISNKYRVGLLSVLLISWVAIHTPAVLYGTDNLPLHQSYVGDEQSPVNGALHVLQAKNPLALRNLPTLYYGPVFASLAVPVVAFDFGEKYIRGLTRSAEAYKNYILFDWGGIVWKARLLSVVTGFLGLVGLYFLLMTQTVNPERNRRIALIGTLLLAFNFYFFEYSSFFKHWIYIVACMLWQLYFVLRIHEEPARAGRYFMAHVALASVSFGISYASLLTQIVFLPSLTLWVRKRNLDMLRLFGYYVLGLTTLLALIIAWHPRSFLRIAHLVFGDLTVAGTSEWSWQVQSTGYSYKYYGTLLLVNHLPLVVLAAFYVKNIGRKMATASHVLLPALTVILVFFLLFGTMSHHEGRYILPVIVASVVAIAVLFVRFYGQLSRALKIMTIVLLVAYFSYHMVHIARWLTIFAEGPAEKHMIAEVLALQGDIKTPVLLVQGYIAGHVHSRDAYEAYIEKRGRQDMNLYRAIMDAPLPQSLPLLNVRYVWPQEYQQSPDLIDGYDIVYKLEIQRPDEINQFDYMDENLLRLWRWDELMPYYVRLK